MSLTYDDDEEYAPNISTSRRESDSIYSSMANVIRVESIYSTVSVQPKSVDFPITPLSLTQDKYSLQELVQQALDSANDAVLADKSYNFTLALQSYQKTIMNLDLAIFYLNKEQRQLNSRALLYNEDASIPLINPLVRTGISSANDNPSRESLLQELNLIKSKLISLHDQYSQRAESILLYVNFEESCFYNQHFYVPPNSFKSIPSVTEFYEFADCRTSVLKLDYQHLFARTTKKGVDKNDLLLSFMGNIVKSMTRGEQILIGLFIPGQVWAQPGIGHKLSGVEARINSLSELMDAILPLSQLVDQDGKEFDMKTFDKAIAIFEKTQENVRPVLGKKGTTNKRRTSHQYPNNFNISHQQEGFLTTKDAENTNGSMSSLFAFSQPSLSGKSRSFRMESSLPSNQIPPTPTSSFKSHHSRGVSGSFDKLKKSFKRIISTIPGSLSYSSSIDAAWVQYKSDLCQFLLISIRTLNSILEVSKTESKKSMEIRVGISKTIKFYLEIICPMIQCDLDIVLERWSRKWRCEWTS